MRTVPIALAMIAAAGALRAQHHDHAPEPTPPPGEHVHAPDTPPAKDAPADRNLFESDMLPMLGMVPDDPMHGMTMPKWHLMDLGVARVLFNGQGGPSGRKGGESSNWNMFHAQKDLGPGRFSFMLMNSLEPATFPVPGSQELFQTGEAYQGKPIVDRQHPHDFFMNLSATYRQQVGARSAFWLQLAPVGDPALGPTAFMHRASSGDNPTAPLGHHWEDSTHIAFDVITAGFGWKAVSIEGSVFHGAEPDEERWGIESGPLDSASGRIWLRFRDGWSGQVSYGFLSNPEALAEGDLRRLTASVSYGAAGDRPFAATLLWGRNDEEHGVTNAVLLEGAWNFTARDQIYGRAEYTQKDYELLATKELHDDDDDHGGEPQIADVYAFTVGYMRDFELVKGLETGIGADTTVYAFPSGLKPVYGSFPVSGHFFLRLRWGSAHAAGHAM